MIKRLQHDGYPVIAPANPLRGVISDSAYILTPSGTPAWRTFLVASDDRAIDPAAERFMAQRAGAATVEINSSSVAMISHPGKVTSLIETAASATAQPPGARYRSSTSTSYSGAPAHPGWRWATFCHPQAA